MAIAQTEIFSLGTTAHEYLQIGGRTDGLLATVSGYAKVLASGHGALIVWGSLGLALEVVFGRWVTTKGHALGDPLGSVDFSFADSWATTFTGVGALLVTILGTTGIIADNAAPLSNNAFTGLNLLFAL